MLTMLPSWAAKKPLFGKLFLTPAQRQVVDAQRAAYLAQVSPEQTPSVLAVARPQKKIKKSARRVPELSLSSIITTPKGRLVRLNGKYVSHRREGYRVESIPNSNEALFSIKGKTVRIQVGETYVPVKKKVLKTYVLVPKQAQKTKPEKLKTVPTSSTSATQKQDKAVQDMSAQLAKLKKISELMKQQ